MLLSRLPRFLRRIPRPNQHFTQGRILGPQSTFQNWGLASAKPNDNMATSSKIHLTVEDTGILKLIPQTSETAAKTSALLQENHEVNPPFALRQTILTRDIETSYLFQ